MEKSKLHNRSCERASRGQSLVEILIALAVGGLIVGTAATLIAVVLRVSSQNLFLRTATSLNEELMEKVTAYADRQWYCSSSQAGCNSLSCPSGGVATRGLYNVQKGTADTLRHRITIGGGQFAAACGSEQVTLDNITYTRFFFAQNVCRFGGSIVGLTDTTSCASGIEDPSTQFVTVTTNWTTPQGGAGTLSLKKYLARSRSLAFRETDWSKGSTTAAVAPSPPPEAPAVVTVPDGRFHYASSTDYRSEPGELRLSGDP